MTYPLWEKYGLSIPDVVYMRTFEPVVYYNYFKRFKSREDMDRYLWLVELCHHCVSSYLENNPDIANKYRKPGFMYFDIIEMSKATKWSEEAYRLISNE